MGDRVMTARKTPAKRRIQKLVSGCAVLALMGLLCSCAPVTPPPAAGQPAPVASERLKAAPLEDSGLTASADKMAAGAQTALPVRFQQPSYLLDTNNKETVHTLALLEEDVVIPVGADISSTTGPIPLRDIIKRLADMKGMNVSWASDVNQWVMVDVDIRAEDDFFASIANLLRQIDYYHTVEGNTVVVRYKETRRFHIAMPFLASDYSTGVGGDVLGSSSAGANVVGNVKLTSEGNKFDVWGNIQANLDNILSTWESEEAQKSSSKRPTTEKDGDSGAQAAASGGSAKIGRAYYTIDRPIGMITVTAPRPLQQRIEDYIVNLKRELYRQIAIEAKVVEVILQNDSKTGVDWSKLLDESAFDFNITFGNIDITNPLGDNRGISLNTKAFAMVVDALKKQGETRILANPKISVMNGQPAMINIGEDETYVNKVESTASEGVITFTVTTDSVFSGLGLGVVATIMENDEIVLNLMPVTSQLQDITYETFGGVVGSRVGLPVVKLREMNTTVRVQDGGMLVVGGLIDTIKGQEATKIPLLGDLPLVKKFFRTDATMDSRKELIILMRPKIIS